MKLCRSWLAAPAALLSLLPACAAPSLHGFDPQLERELEPGITGEWYDDDGGKWRVEEGRGKTYDVFVTVPEKKEGEAAGEKRMPRLSVAMVRFGERRLIDVALAEEEIEEVADRYGTLLLPAHQFYRLDQAGDLLRIFLLDHEWVETWPGVIELEQPDRFPLLTSPPKQLRHLLEAAARDDEAWEDPIELRRQRDG
ncbi:MAG: hypothetical protein AB1726_01425 [Planctomycetota bacterium]